MQRFSLLFFICIPFLLFSDPKDPHISAVTEGEPAWNLCRSVNAITGDLFISQNDLTIQAVQPIELSRYYISGDGIGDNGGWQFMPHLTLVLKRGYKDKRNRIYAADPNSSPICYQQQRSNRSLYSLQIEEDGDGITNCGKGIISARTNLRNQSIERFSRHKFQMRSSDGTLRLYQCDSKSDPDDRLNDQITFYLQSERHPNGNWTTYQYDKEDRIKLIQTHNPALTKTYAWAKFHYHGKSNASHNFHIETSDGRNVHYQFDKLGKREKGFYLTHVKSAHLPEEDDKYCSAHTRRGPLVNRRIFPGGRTLNAYYYDPGKNQVGSEYINVHNVNDPICDRVKTLAFPVGNDSSPIETHRFFYSVDKHRRKENGSHYRYSGCTRVYDIEDNLTLFLFTSKSRPKRIEHFQKANGKQILSSTVEYTWQKCTDLHTKTLLDSNGQLLQSRTLSYDDKGNVLEEILTGNLTGGPNATDTYSISYTYDNDNLVLTSEEQDGSCTRFAYLPGTDLVTSKLFGDRNTIYLREFHLYNEDNILIRRITDNGSSPNKDDLANVTQRTIQIITPRTSSPALGLPEVIEERYLDLSTGQEKLLKKIHQSYSPTAQIIKQEIYDANNDYRYSLETTYNIRDLPETETNALGQTTTTHYDLCSNPILISKPSESLTVHHQYDCCNRLVQTIEESPLSQPRTTRHTYDGKHNRTSTTDPSGNTTYFTYDAFGNNLTTQLPPSPDETGTLRTPQHSKTYNSLHQEISSTDPNGHTTEKQYTLRNKPTLIIHPNGSQETHLYNPNGTLCKSTDQEGTTTHYTYDIFKNITSKQIYSPSNELLSQESSTYDAFHILSHTDADGNTTYYTYDGAGRKTAETLISPFGTEQTIYTYDSLGRLHSTQQGDILLINEHDLLDRTIEDREEDPYGNVLIRTLYSYDGAGNKTTTTRFTASGPATETTLFDSFKRPIRIEDPLNNITTIHYEDRYLNNSNQTVLRKVTTNPEQIQTIEIFDTHGNIATLEKLDPSGKRLAYEERFYDSSGNLSCKRSHTIINHQTTAIVTTTWQYGPEKRLLTLIEADSTPEQRITTYTYTPKGLLETITKPDATTIFHTYDPLSRLTTLSSTDIHYVYHYNKLHQVQAVEDQINHTTIYRTYDPKGRLLTETFPNNITLRSQYNSSGQRTQLTLPDNSLITYAYHGTLLSQIDRYNSSGHHLYTHRYLAYDLSGHLLSQQLINNQEMSFTLDLLERPTSITTPSFTQQITAYSPTGNVLQTITQDTTADYHYDHLDQLTEEPLRTYTYDSHHNRLSQNDTAYTHNHLHQILDILIYNPNGAPTRYNDTRYTYDALDRLTSIQTPTELHTFTYDAWHRCLIHNTEHLLYDGQNEIGSYNSSGIHQLRILGIGHGAEIGSSVALELDNTIATPIHDLFGNIISLLDSTATIASYRYTAFGEQQVLHSSLSNPWGFSSKRHFNDLVYFGRRFYSPQLGRWLTPDPAGYTEGPNLYAFVLNTPLTKIDLYGLFALTELAVFGRDFPKNARALPSYLRGEHPLSEYHYFNEEHSQPIPNDARPPGMIVLINGINTSYEELTARVDHIAKTYGVVCHGIYNPTHNPILDVVKCGISIARIPGTRNSTYHALQKFNLLGCRQMGPEGAILNMPHSKGALDLTRAFQGLPENIREQLHVVAFAPASIISKKLGAYVMNYASIGFDPVVLRDYRGVIRGLMEGNLKFLPLGKGASLIGDHPFNSTTFDKPKYYELEKFTQTYNCTIPWKN